MHRFLLFSLLILFSSAPLSSSLELTVSSHPSTEVIENSPGSRPSDKLTCNRVHIRGYSRLRHLSKYAHMLKIRLSVSESHAHFQLETIELCFHRNASIGVGMCHASQWMKLSKNYWVHYISPYEHRILDIRMPSDPAVTIELTTSEEFSLHRVTFLIVGMITMLLAHTLSESLVFYYCGAMTTGIIILVLVVLFRGMKLLPTGRLSSLEIFVYSSVVGVATFLLHHLSEFVREVMMVIRIGEDLHIPLGRFLILVVVLLVGVWFGIRIVRKLVLTAEGSIDSRVAYSVEWSILIISAVTMLQSSLDIILSTMALALSFVLLAISRTEGKLRLLRQISRSLVRGAQVTGAFLHSRPEETLSAADMG